MSVSQLYELFTGICVLTLSQVIVLVFVNTMKGLQIKHSQTKRQRTRKTMEEIMLDNVDNVFD